MWEVRTKKHWNNRSPLEFASSEFLNFLVSKKLQMFCLVMEIIHDHFFLEVNLD